MNGIDTRTTGNAECRSNASSFRDYHLFLEFMPKSSVGSLTMPGVADYLPPFLGGITMFLGGIAVSFKGGARRHVRHVSFLKLFAEFFNILISGVT